MKRIRAHVVSVCAIALGLAAFAPACAENDGSIFIRQVMAPATNRQNGRCIYTDDPQQPALFKGTFDLGVTDFYGAVVLVGNQMIQRGDPNNTRAESNRVHLNGAVVKVMEPDGTSINEFTALASGLADPQANNNPDYGLMFVTLIDGPTKDMLAGSVPTLGSPPREVVINLKAFGKTLGGIDLESGEFQFTITVCNGCLVSFAGADDPAQNPRPNCKAALAEGGQRPCTTGQDEAVPCQLCQGRDACDPAKWAQLP